MREKLANYLSIFKKTPSKEITRWKAFEELVLKWSGLKGYEVETQKPITTTNKRLDIFAKRKKNPKDKIIIECKWQIKAKLQHIKQLQKYHYPIFPLKKYLAYPMNVDMSETFKELAKEKGIGIIKLKINKVKEKTNMFGKKKYIR
jgi:RecB family endonuclease NucS